MNYTCNNRDCLLCICSNSTEIAADLLKDLLNDEKAQENLKKCNYTCFVKAICICEYCLDTNIVPNMLAIFFKSTGLNKIEALNVIFSDPRLKNISKKALVNLMKQFDEETLRKFYLEKVSPQNSTIDRKQIDSLECMQIFKGLQTSPPEKKEVEKEDQNSMDYFGVCELKTSTTHLVQSANQSLPKVNEFEEKKVQILEKIPLYLKTIAEKQLGSNLYISLIRINKILIQNDEISTRAIIFASQKTFAELDKVCQNQSGEFSIFEVTFLSDVVCQILQDCNTLK